MFWCLILRGQSIWHYLTYINYQMAKVEIDSEPWFLGDHHMDHVRPRHAVADVCEVVKDVPRHKLIHLVGEFGSCAQLLRPLETIHARWVEEVEDIRYLKMLEDVDSLLNPASGSLGLTRDLFSGSHFGLRVATPVPSRFAEDDQGACSAWRSCSFLGQRPGNMQNVAEIHDDSDDSCAFPLKRV